MWSGRCCHGRSSGTARTASSDTATRRSCSERRGGAGKRLCRNRPGIYNRQDHRPITEGAGHGPVECLTMSAVARATHYATVRVAVVAVFPVRVGVPVVHAVPVAELVWVVVLFVPSPPWAICISSAVSVRMLCLRRASLLRLVFIVFLLVS